jgi:AcrR family transcriptional regulator
MLLRFGWMKKTPQREPKQARAKATIDIILEATAQILIDGGYERLTTNHVAKRAGVSVGTIYQYFDSKEALVAAIIERHIAKISALAMSELAHTVDAPFEEGARRMIRALIAAQRVDPALHRAVLEQVPRLGKLDRIRTLDRDFEALLHAALEARRGEIEVVDKRLFAFVVVHATKATSLAAVLDHPEYLEDDMLADALADMFVAYARRVRRCEADDAKEKEEEEEGEESKLISSGSAKASR